MLNNYLKYSTKTPPKRPQSFTGKERDSETGLSYFGARYYDSDVLTGWLSVDPISDKYPSLSPYTYCGWNPIRLVDPNGEEIDEPPLQRILNAISSKTNEKMESVKRPTILKNNIDAIAHYYSGQGKAIKLDNNLGVLLTQTEEFKEKHKKIVNGKTQSLTGNFGVDMTFVDVNTFFIGDTRVDYSIAISEDKSKCTITYTLFAQDRFNDPNFIKETFGKILNGKLVSFNADREGSNLEFGGIPYDFIPQKKIYTFDNPGYENKQ